jgi:hypothetical protein
MANWGRPDFKEDAAVDAQAVVLRSQLEAAGKISAWHLEGPAGFNIPTVRYHCVDTSRKIVADWQQVRLSMKGKDTTEKLSILKAWWDKDENEDNESVFVQVYNYLGALRRGGQLDSLNRVRKAR